MAADVIVAKAGASKVRSPAMRLLRRIGWNLLPPLTFLAIVGLWWAVVEAFRSPPTSCRARAPCSPALSPTRRCFGRTRR